jgi:AraC family transcriptional regulator of arabinose operon
MGWAWFLLQSEQGDKQEVLRANPHMVLTLFTNDTPFLGNHRALSYEIAGLSSDFSARPQGPTRSIFMKRSHSTVPMPGGDTASVFVGMVDLTPGNTAGGAYAHWTLSFILSGRCLYSCGGGTTTLEAGDFLLSRPQAYMSWKVVESPRGERWQPYFAIFNPRPHWHDWLNYPETFPGLTVLHFGGTELFPVIRRRMKSAHRIYQSSTPNRDDFTLLVLERMLLEAHVHQQERSSGLDERIQDALEYMETHYRETLTISAVARAATLSVSQFSLLFTEQVGTTPMQHLENIRLRRASELLRFSTLPIGEVSSAVGFRDPVYFARRFRLRTERTPREFRRTG